MDLERSTQEEASDDFENEMNLELETRVRVAAVDSGGIRNIASLIENKTLKPNNVDQEDDSDEEYLDDWEQATKSKDDKINDDLLYDPNMDDEDQKWADDLRRTYTQQSDPTATSSRVDNAAVAKLPNSDAVLNCPACFVVLCLDCQRHTTYEHQYRAMFVLNCTVDHTQAMKYPQTGAKKKGKGKNALPAGDANETFNPVKCNRCTTQVAVYDKDEVYHFFNVLASH
jgi:hypothetical protein